MSNLEFSNMDGGGGGGVSPRCAKAWVAGVSLSTVGCAVAAVVLGVTQGALHADLDKVVGTQRALHANLDTVKATQATAAGAHLVDCGGGLVVHIKDGCGATDLACNCPVPDRGDQCPDLADGVTVVQNVASLTLAEKQAIVAGVHKMKTVPSKYDPTLNAWDYFVALHRSATAPVTEVHAGWYFYPWHREMMWRMTSELRRVTGDDKIAFPYWNWADSESTDSMFGLDYMGPRAGLQQQQYVVKEGNFREGKWVISEDLQHLPEEKQYSSILRAPGNGLQMCFDQDQNSYFLDTAQNPPNVDRMAVVGPFHYLPPTAPPGPDSGRPDVYMKPRLSNIAACGGGGGSWTKLACDRYYDALNGTDLSASVKFLRCQHYATTLPTSADYDRCQKLPKYTTNDASKLGPIDKSNPFATAKDYSNSYTDFFRACFEGIDPSDTLAKGLERIGASLHPPHGATHTYSGGSMATPTSPNDPLFSGLHWNVDRKFAEWQKQHGNGWFTDGPKKDMLDQPMPVLDNPKVTLREVLEHKDMLFTYDTVC